jgi:hypothetical protein
MIDPIELSISQQFEMERMDRAIDSTDDVEVLRDLAKTLLKAWMTQKASCVWVMKNNLGTPFDL